MSKAYNTTESHVEEAIQVYYNSDFTSAATTAKAYKVESYHLQRCLKEQASKFT